MFSPVNLSIRQRSQQPAKLVVCELPRSGRLHDKSLVYDSEIEIHRAVHCASKMYVVIRLDRG